MVNSYLQHDANGLTGLLPKKLKRGVLSEDGLYNLLEHYDLGDSNPQMAPDFSVVIF